MPEGERLARLETKVDILSSEMALVRHDVALLLAQGADPPHNGRTLIVQYTPWALGGTGLGALMMKLLDVLAK